jgi:uncharacterized protein (TIGR03000 family)
MYSVVLMTALTVGGEVPDFGRRGGRCGGCYGGCYGGWAGCYGCSGGGCCGGWGGYGCFGGGCWGGYGCSGCSGGGYVGSGGWGGGYGRWGGYGGYGGMGRGYGRAYSGAPYAPMFGYAAPLAPGVVYTAQVQDVAPPVTTSSVAAPATIVVNLPPDASLTVQGQPTRSASSRRVFVSPPLDPNQSYSYTLRATVTRNGEPLSVVRQVAVRPGRQTEVNLAFPAASASARR